MGEYTSYFLYQKYEKRGDQDWLPCYPNVYSVDGDGTMPLVMKKEYDQQCGYTGGCDPQYDWVEIPIDEDYECDECDLSIQTRWVDYTDAFTYFGDYKYGIQILETKVEDGEWTRANQTKYTTNPIGKAERKMIIETSDGSSYSVRCGTSDGRYYNYPSTMDEWFYQESTDNSGLFDDYKLCHKQDLFKIEADEYTCGGIGQKCWRDEPNDWVLRPTEYGQTITGVTFGDCVTEIGNTNYCTGYDANTNNDEKIGFMIYPNLVSVTLPNTVEKIGTGVFSGNTGLTTITFPDSLKNLGAEEPAELPCNGSNGIEQNDCGTFEGCGLVDVNTNKIEQIGRRTFADNFSLIKITIGSGCTRLDEAVFNNCPNLRQIIFEGSTVPECHKHYAVGNPVSSDVSWKLTDTDNYTGHNPEYLPSECKIYVPCDSLSIFKNSPLTSGYTDIIYGYGGSCGDIPYITEYRTVSGTPYCDNGNLYQDVYSQVSTDGGNTWETTATTTTLIEAGSTQCNYNPENEYLTFIMLSSGGGSIGFSGASTAKTVEYSVDSGATWTALPASRYTEYTENVNEGDEIMFRGNLVSKSGIIGKFVTDSNIALKGNIMSLLYSDNFSGQTSLSSCTFNDMFSSCYNLTNAENLVLPATTLTVSCYLYMFYGCGNLMKAPSVLPATTLTVSCYQQMFDGCTALTEAPELPATTLIRGCYHGMFAGCTNLSYIKCLATDISARNCTTNWVNNVSANGTFVKNSSMNSWTTGVNGIPSGWTVEDAT